MPKAVIAARFPIKVSLEAEKKYYWCQCGLSKKQPFCDGSHVGTGIKPLEFVAKESGDKYLCQCKQTHDAPFCDGTHKTLPEGVTEMELPTRGGSKASEMPEPKNTPEEPTLEFIHELAKHGLSKAGMHGPIDAMGVPRDQLPSWDDIQILTAQMATKPLEDDAKVNTQLVIGPNAKKPLVLDIPLFVSDMSFGALSREAKISLARGAELAGTGICSGEGGMLAEEQQENSRYFYELASAKFGFKEELLSKVQAFHFKGGQAAKTGTGGHLPAAKVTEEIAKVRHLPADQDAISPAAFPDLTTPADFKALAEHVRELTGGIPIGFKLSAQHIEKDIDFALEASADYIILDGRGGATGAAPLLFRDNISVPTIPALARARLHLDKLGRKDITLIITGGLRTPADFIKALCLGADGIALSNSAIQAIGCIGARICHTNNCPAGITTQQPHLRERLQVQVAAERLMRFFHASTELMQVMARACGHASLSEFNLDDLTTWKRDIAELSGVAFGGVKNWG